MKDVFYLCGMVFIFSKIGLVWCFELLCERSFGFVYKDYSLVYLLRL